MIKADYSKENLEKLVKESWCFADLSKKLGICLYAKRLKQKLDKLNLDYSHFRKQKPKIENDILSKSNSLIYNKIIELRKQNKSYNEIALELNCSKSIISYHLSAHSRETHKNRISKSQRWIKKLIKKIDHFNENKSKIHIKLCKDWKMKLRSAVNKFSKRKGEMEKFSYKEVLNKYNNSTIITDYISGDVIDITKDNYNLDHIIPKAKGGLNTIDNLAIVTPTSNKVKSDLTKEELLEFCEKVLKHNGYIVYKKK